MYPTWLSEINMFNRSFKHRYRNQKNRKALLAKHFLVSLAFVCFGVFIFYKYFIVSHYRYFACQKWINLPCQVVSVKLGEKKGSNERVFYKIICKYAYVYKDSEYISNEYALFADYSKDYSRIENKVKEISGKDNVFCYVNPTNPSESIIDRTYHLKASVGLIGVVFFGIGAHLWFCQKELPESDNRSSDSWGMGDMGDD